MRRMLFCALGAALVLGVGVAGAITNGTLDGDAHPYVGLLVFDDADGPRGGAAAR